MYKFSFSIKVYEIKTNAHNTYNLDYLGYVKLTLLFYVFLDYIAF